MRQGERIALWTFSIIPTILLLAVGVPWAFKIQSAVSAVTASVDRQEAIDARLVQIYERVRTVQEAIEKKFDQEGK